MDIEIDSHEEKLFKKLCFNFAFEHKAWYFSQKQADEDWAHIIARNTKNLSRIGQIAWNYMCEQL
jgi:hypothetical protein